MAEAKVSVAETGGLCDIIVAERLDPTILFQPDNWQAEKHRLHKSESLAKARRSLEDFTRCIFR